MRFYAISCSLVYAVYERAGSDLVREGGGYLCFCLDLMNDGSVAVFDGYPGRISCVGKRQQNFVL